MKAIVIDDAGSLRSILKRFLGMEGFECIDAADGALALAKLEDSPPQDLALVDWNMPVMDGLTFVQRVRADSRYASMRIMMVTTETEIDRIQQALDAGANEYLMKPFSREMLKEKLALLGLGGA